MPEQSEAPIVGVIMGSESDMPVMEGAIAILEAFGVPHEVRIVSAHRTPQRLHEYAGNAHERGLRIIIAGAGGAAHLPGMTAALTPLPVIGVPVKSKALSGFDSLLSIVQMPPGIPVGTMSIDGAKNAALFTVAILATTNESLFANLVAWRAEQTDSIPLKPKREGEPK